MPVTDKMPNQSQIGTGDDAMNKDKRDLVDVLKRELQFVEKGGYQHPSRAPWRPQFMFQNSPTCLNFKSSGSPVPCAECVMMQVVPADSQQKNFPCRHIPLNEQGETLDLLYRTDTQKEIETVFKDWLKTTIARLERERAESVRVCDQPEVHVHGKWVVN
jgi:hypothetical protein